MEPKYIEYFFSTNIIRCILNYKYLKASLVLAFFSLSIGGFAQNAEELFSKYWKVGVTGNRATYFAENQPNPLDYELYNQDVYNLGLTWNFHQKGNHNFKVSVLKNIKYWEDAYMRIKNEDVPLPSDANEYARILSVRTSNSQWKFNLLYEHFFKLNNNIYVSGAVGPEVLYYPKKRASGAFGIGVIGGDSAIIRMTE